MPGRCSHVRGRPLFARARCPDGVVVYVFVVCARARCPDGVVVYFFVIFLLCAPGLATAKSKCCCSIQKRKGPGTKSISVIAKVAWCKINFIGLLLYRKEVRTNSDYRICTSSILYGLVRNPALPPESPQQIGFGVVRVTSEQELWKPGTQRRPFYVREPDKDRRKNGNPG